MLHGTLLVEEVLRSEVVSVQRYVAVTYVACDATWGLCSSCVLAIKQCRERVTHEFYLNLIIVIQETHTRLN